MAGLYNDTIAVHRLRTVATTGDAVGDVGYSGAEQSTSSPEGEAVLVTGLPANIQQGAAGRKKSTALPTDIVYAPTWVIFIPASAAAKGTIMDRDILVDQFGYRYEVGQNRYSLFGYRLTCVRLEA